MGISLLKPCSAIRAGVAPEGARPPAVERNQLLFLGEPRREQTHRRHAVLSGSTRFNTARSRNSRIEGIAAGFQYLAGPPEPPKADW